MTVAIYKIKSKDLDKLEDYLYDLGYIWNSYPDGEKRLRKDMREHILKSEIIYIHLSDDFQLTHGYRVYDKCKIINFDRLIKLKKLI